MRCSAPLDGIVAFVHHVFMRGWGGDQTCIGVELPGETLLEIIREARRERLH